MTSKTQRRKRGNDRAAKMRSAALGTATSFWDAVRDRYAEDVQELADRARDDLTLRDLRALEAAEMVEIEAQIETVASHKARTILRGAARQCRRNLGLLVIAENPTLDLNKQLVPIPDGMMVDRGVPAAERTARKAERRAGIEADKIEILTGILAGAPEDHYLHKLWRYPREQIERMRDDALRARLRAEDEARAAWADLEAQRAAGRVVYAADPDDGAAVFFGDVDGDGNELLEDIAAELRDDPDEADGDEDSFGDL